MTDPFTAASPTYIAAQRTNQGGGRDWTIVPEEPKTPIFVWQFIGWSVGLTCLFVFTPVIVRALMSWFGGSYE